MIYSQNYDVNRTMHLRPCGQTSLIVKALQEGFPGLEVILENSRNGAKVKGYSVLDYMTILQPLKGDRIQITLVGEFSENFLKEQTKQVGNTFSLYEEIPELFEEMRKLEEFYRNLK